MYKKERCYSDLSSELEKRRFEELGNLYGPEKAAQYDRFEFEHIGHAHELCPDWEHPRQIDVNFFVLKNIDFQSKNKFCLCPFMFTPQDTLFLLICNRNKPNRVHI
jgi:hypothetical protein